MVGICMVRSLPLTLSFFHINFSLICIRHLKACQFLYAPSFFFIFKIFDQRLVHWSRVSVNEEVTVHVRIIDAQLFLGSQKNYFNSVIRLCDHHRFFTTYIWSSILQFDILSCSYENCLKCKSNRGEVFEMPGLSHFHLKKASVSALLHSFYIPTSLCTHLMKEMKEGRPH